MFTSKSIGRTTLLLAMMTLALSGATTFAEDTLFINYQGYLTDDAGDPITGTKTISFSIYDDIGIILWTETHSSIYLESGFFDCYLGVDMAISVFNGECRYLGITVGDDDEMVPRTRLTSVPGAAYARQLVGDVITGPGMMLVKNSAGDSAVILAADPGVHAMRLYPPDPCVPPEPCLPAIEIQANNENRIDLYLPGGEVEEGLVQLSASAETGGFISIHNTDPQCAEGIRLSGGATNANAITMFGGGHGLEYKLLEMKSQTDIGSSIKLIPLAGDSRPGIELTVDAATSTGSFRIGKPPPDDGKPSVEIVATMSVATVMVQGEDPGGEPPRIALIAGAEGAKVGIGTDSPVEALTVMGNGWFSGDVFTFMDIKGKRNIVPIDGALDKVSRMNGYYYDCRTDEYPGLRPPEDRQIGFLAEEVNEVVPEAVGENEYGLTGVSYSRITALLVEAVKELKAENEELRLRLEALEGR